MLVFHILLLVVLSYLLGVSARFATRSAHRVAKFFHTNDFVIGFFIVGVATSTPEITVAIDSALRGAPGLSLGNLLGASIVILSLLAGLAAILAGKLSINRFLRHDDFLLYLAVIVLPVVAVADGRLTRFDGVWLILAYILFTMRLYSRRQIYGRHIAAPLPNGRRVHVPRELGILLLALGGIVLSAYYLVNSALFVAAATSIPPLIIGLLVLSIGTNLPEFTLVLTQSYRQGQNLVLGDLLSNVLLNVPTLGLLALISPFTITTITSVATSAVFLIVAAVLFGALMWSKDVLTRREGVLLFAIYAVYAVNHLTTLIS